MPCNCGFPVEDVGVESTNFHIVSDGERISVGERKDKKIKELHELADKTMQMFCYACGLLREKGVIEYPAKFVNGIDDRFIAFLGEHDRMDMKRTSENMKVFVNNGCKDPEALRTIFTAVAKAVHPLSEWHRTVYFDEVLKKIGIAK